MKIQHKRSNQLDSGEAKAPLVDFMEYGELAVNFNKNDPAIFVKVSDGTNALNDEVIRIAGLGSISGGVPDGPTGERPDTPSLGDLYFDTDLNLLLYWDGSEWKPVGKDNVALISESAPNTTQYPEGTFWWDSSEDSGRLFILYNDPTDANELFWVEASPGGSGGSKTVVQEAPPAPGNFVEGDMWWSSASDSGQLFILYDDPVDNGGGGKTWVAAAPSNNATDYVKKAGDNMTGPLTIGPDGGTPVTTLADDGSAEFASDVQMASQNGGPLAGFRNQIINGDFSITQRGPFATTTAAAYSFDRWLVPGATTWSAIAHPNSPAEFKGAARIQGTLSVVYMRQMIEFYTQGNPAPFALNTTWTFSCWSTIDSTTDVVANFSFGDNNETLGNQVDLLDGNAVMSKTGRQISISSGVGFNTWYQYSCTFTVEKPPAATNLGLGVGVVLLNNSATDCGITGVQLEPGPVATPFEHRPIGTELALCQRYFQALYPWGHQVSQSILVAGRQAYFTLPVVPMRATPTFNNTYDNSGNVYVNEHSAGASFTIAPTWSYIGEGTTVTASYDGQLNNTNVYYINLRSNDARFQFDAEL